MALELSASKILWLSLCSLFHIIVSVSVNLFTRYFYFLYLQKHLLYYTLNL